MKERIVIKSPLRNADSERDNLAYATEVQQVIVEEMARVGITPQKYPRAVDFAAGNGSFAAKILLPRGWQAHNITNIDIATPDPDLSAGTKWLHLDLERLGYTLSCGGKLPHEISNEQGKYDFGSEESGFGVHDYMDYLADFFLRKGGVCWTTLGRTRLLQPRIGGWKQVETFLFEKQ